MPRSASILPLVLALAGALAWPRMGLAQTAAAPASTNAPAAPTAAPAAPGPAPASTNPPAATAPAAAPTPTPVDRTAFDAAVRTLQSGFGAQAADDLAAFVQKNPGSPLLPEATLLEARTRADLGQLDAALGILAERLDKVGALRDQALHLRAEVFMRRGDYEAAAAAYHQIVTDVPQSPLLLKAGFGEALARFRAGRPAESLALLLAPTNAFARGATNLPNDELVVRGHLLLAEAQLRTGAAEAATGTLDRLTNRPLTPVQLWERQLLLISVLLTNRQPEAALGATSQLLALASTSASRDLLARSHAVRGTVLQTLGRSADAFAAYTNNLAEPTPPAWRRDALLAIADLPLAAGLAEPALQLLTPLAESPQADAPGVAARLAVAELRLQLYFDAPPPPPTGHLAAARTLLLTVLTNASTPPIPGRAWYDLGWIHTASTQPAPAADAFARAVDGLAGWPLQALALFKLADAQLQATNHGAALTNYLRVIREFGNSPLVGRGILERALYQGALAALEAGQQVLASDLAGRAVVEFPNGDFRDDTRVLYGQTLARLDPPGLARGVLQQLAARLTNSPALPEIQLNVARSFAREGSWSNTLQQLDDWTRAYPTHPSASRAEFDRAWAAFRTGDDNRAYGLFTNFLARFPDHPSAPQAQLWVGDYLFRLGSYAGAEASYQIVYQRTNWPVSRLTHEARLMAGKAAFARQGYKDAKPYFLWLIANGPPAVTNSLVPPELVARAYFALGDCFLQEPESDDTLRDAMNAFAAVIDRFPDSREALLARGKLGNCHLARAGLDPAQSSAAYTNAAKLYLEVIQAPAADVTARSQAEVGLATVLEKRSATATGAERETLQKESLGRLLGVFHGRNLRPGENASPFWLNRAGLEAARLAESLGLREQAANLYESLARTFPASAAAFRQRATQLRGPG